MIKIEKLLEVEISFSMKYKYRSISKAKNVDINTEKHKYDELEGSVRVKCEWSIGNSRDIVRAFSPILGLFSILHLQKATFLLYKLIFT
jgi:hypothetical protein